MNREELILKAKDIVNSDVIIGFSGEPIKKAANTDLDKFSKFLQEISEQAWDPATEESAIKTYSKELIDIVKKLYPKNNDYPFLEIKEEKIKGGLSDNLTLKDIAKKFDKNKTVNEFLKTLKKELEMGIKVELEHTKDKGKAKEIAMDHLSEIPDYYTRLKKMEKSANKKWGTIKEFINIKVKEELKKKA